MLSLTGANTLTTADDGVHDNSVSDSTLEPANLVIRLQYFSLEVTVWSNHEACRFKNFGLPCDSVDKGKAAAWRLGSNTRVVSLEGVLGRYRRDVVDFEETKPGGALRGIVKVVVRFPGRSVMGTGVLIDKSTVLTAGHLLVRGWPALDVKVIAGRSGGSPDVEKRCGIYAAVHSDWLIGESLANDIGFIRLETPFKTVEPLRYRQTPLTGNGGMNVRIYGYPADMPTNAKGRDLCLSQAPLWYRASLGVAEHQGDTEVGTSGGPVIDDEDFVIAIHNACRPDANGNMVNTAVTIDRRGNNTKNFSSVLDHMMVLDQTSGEDSLEAEQVGNGAGIKLLGELPGTKVLIFDWTVTPDDASGA